MIRSQSKSAPDVTDDKPDTARRSLLVPIAFGAMAVGAGFALWPFIAALGPPADIRARRVVFALADLHGNAPSLVQVGNKAVMIFRRTPQELALLRDPPQPLTERARNETASWHRSHKPEIAVLAALCAHGDCIVRRASPVEPEFICPCCSSRYDLAGRVLAGPASANLAVPPHDYIGETAIEFPEYGPT